MGQYAGCVLHVCFKKKMNSPMTSSECCYEFWSIGVILDYTVLKLQKWTLFTVLNLHTGIFSKYFSSYTFVITYVTDVWQKSIFRFFENVIMNLLL